MKDLKDVPSYHGEPSQELTKAIWDEAKTRFPDAPTWQSCFNDGCHWLIQRLRRSVSESLRLQRIDEANRPWIDKEAFVALNSQMSAALKQVIATFAEVIGDEGIDALWFASAADENDAEVTAEANYRESAADKS